MDRLASLRRAADLVPRDEEALARARALLMARATEGRGVCRCSAHLRAADHPHPCGAPANPGPSRRALLAGAAAAVAAVGVGGSVVVGTGRAEAGGLLVAAAQVTDRRLVPGRFLKATTLIDLRGPAGALARTVQEVWIPYDRQDVWTQRDTAPGGRVRTQRARLGQLPAVQDWEAVQLVAETPGSFRTVLPWMPDAKDPRWSFLGIEWAQGLLSSGEVSAVVRARIYRWLAALPGVQERGTARLASGRTGTVFAADDPLRRARWEIVVDGRTGEYLGDRYWDRGPGTPADGLLRQARALTTAIVDRAP